MIRHPYNSASCLVAILACLLALSGCDRPITYPGVFAEADSLASANPDSAVALLTSIREPMKNQPEHIRNYYHLLCIKANDKAYIRHTSDSLIKSLVQYYEGAGDKRRLPEAYYYAGRVLCDMKDAPQAMEYFGKSLEIADEKTDMALKGALYSQMGRIFHDQELTEQSIILMRKACQYDILLNDTEALSYDLSDIGDIYWDRFQLDSAEFYYKASIATMETLKDTQDINMMKTKLGNLYIDLHRYDEIEKLIRPYLNLHYEFDKKYIYGLMAKYFLTTKQWDSASIYYEKCLPIDNVITKSSTYWGLSQIAIAHHDIPGSQYYLAQYKLFQDSIQKLNRTQEVGRTYFKQIYDLHLKENILLREENDRKQRYIIIILCILGVTLAGIATYVIVRYRKKARFRPGKYATSPQLEESPVPSVESEIPMTVPEIENLEIKPKMSPSASISEQPAADPEEGTGRQSVKDAPLSLNSSPAMPLPELFNYLTDMVTAHKILSDHDWVNIENTIRSSFPGFLSKLCEAYPCSIIELRVSMLVKLNVPPAAIASLIGRSKEAVSSTRRRLYEKAFGEKGNAKKWDTFIQSI